MTNGVIEANLQKCGKLLEGTGTSHAVIKDKILTDFELEVCDNV